MPAVPGPLAPPQPSIIFGNPQRRRDDDDAGVSLPAIAKAKRGESSSEGGTLSAVGRCGVAALCLPAVHSAAHAPGDARVGVHLHCDGTPEHGCPRCAGRR